MGLRTRASGRPLIDLSEELLAHIDELGAEMAKVIMRDVDFYRATAVISEAEIRDSCRANATFVFRSLVNGGEPDVTPAVETGIARALAGVPLAAVMAAYRVGFRYMWEKAVEMAREVLGIPPETVLDATAQIVIAQDMFTQAMTGAYRQQMTIRILDQEEERSALVEAVLFHRITDIQSLWEAADLLRLPAKGPYVVVAVAVPNVGKLGLPEIGSKLDARDIRSAWRLLSDLQVGIVHLRRSEALGELVAILGGAASSRVGVSPPFDDLADTHDGLRLARLAVVSRPTGDSLVTVFDDSPLAYAAVSAPETMARISRSVLGPLDDLPADERKILVDTFNGWLDAGGSANEAAAALYCHPNTVRHRLHRIEERTGRSLTSPRDIAELCLAFEIDGRLPG